MRVSMSLGNHSWPEGPSSIGRRVSSLVRLADQTEIDTLWAMDHLFQIPINGPATDPLLESQALLGFVAGHTQRIRFGTLVTGVSYRHPGLLVKSLTALDVLSGGRAWLGIGAAWHEEEARAFGLPFPERRVRYEWLEETLQIAHRMWAGDARPFEGRHHRLEHPFNHPNSVQRPHPPILVGGSGERKTLRLVARYADACNLFDVPEGVEVAGTVGGHDELRRKLDVLRAHCDDVGRPYDDIEKTIVSTFAITAGGKGNGDDDAKGAVEIVDHFGGLAEVGLDHVIFEPSHPWTEATLELVARVVPEVSRLP